MLAPIATPVLVTPALLEFVVNKFNFTDIYGLKEFDSCKRYSLKTEIDISSKLLHAPF